MFEMDGIAYGESIGKRKGLKTLALGKPNVRGREGRIQVEE